GGVIPDGAGLAPIPRDAGARLARRRPGGRPRLVPVPRLDRHPRRGGPLAGPARLPTRRVPRDLGRARLRPPPRRPGRRRRPPPPPPGGGGPGRGRSGRAAPDPSRARPRRRGPLVSGAGRGTSLPGSAGSEIVGPATRSTATEGRAAQGPAREVVHDGR